MELKTKNLLLFYNEGYFKITSPQTDGEVLQILVADVYYPYYDKYEELVKPLIFITTNDEFQKMRGSDFPRDAFEEFVNMTISTNQSISRNLFVHTIRIRRSARLFTSDRKGWKTDRGMLYQILEDHSKFLETKPPSCGLTLLPMVEGFAIFLISFGRMEP